MGLWKGKPKPSLEGYDDVDPGDRQVLSQMVAMGAVLTNGRHVLHYSYFPTQEAAESAASPARDAGWEVAVEPSASNDGTWCALAQRHGHVLSAETVIADRIMFSAAAANHGGEYDGWEASMS